MSLDKYLTKYPRFIRALQWVAILSQYEAAGAIRAHIEYNDMSGAACEAVAHWCEWKSVVPLLERAFACRHCVRVN